MSNETVSLPPDANSRDEVERVLREASNDAVGYLRRARVCRRREASDQVHQELARLARGRPRTGIDVATFWLAFAAIASGAVSLVIVFVELLGR